MPKASANGIEIEYASLGKSKLGTFVLVSGLGVQMIRWPGEFCEILARAGYRVLLFDNRDVGLSTSFAAGKSVNFEELAQALARGEPLAIPYTLQDMVNDVAGLLDCLQISRVHLVGRSMGGMIAQLFASQHPSRAASLTAMMSSTGNPSLPSANAQVMNALMKRAPNPAEDLEGYLANSISFSKLIGSPAYPTADTALREQALRELRRAYSPSAIERQIAALAAAGDIRRHLKLITAPTLVVHGTSDALIPAECGKDIAKNIEDAELLLIDGMGHDFPEQLYGTVGEAILSTACRT